jgi:hypothetical protein
MYRYKYKVSPFNLLIVWILVSFLLCSS